MMQLQFSERVIRTNVGDFTHEESLRAPPAGNSLNWVLGHIVATRCRFLAALGAESVWSDAECRPYDRHAPAMTKATEAKPLAEIWNAFELSQKRLLNVLGGTTAEDLAQALPPDPSDGSVRTRAELLAVIGFHDGYHAGQTGMLRRLVGRAPADL
jgi:uncharacterized damage-inducible protein DinB